MQNLIFQFIKLEEKNESVQFLHTSRINSFQDLRSTMEKFSSF